MSTIYIMFTRLARYLVYFNSIVTIPTNSHIGIFFTCHECNNDEQIQRYENEGEVYFIEAGSSIPFTQTVVGVFYPVRCVPRCLMCVV